MLSFFEEKSNGQMKPRCVYMDAEPDTIEAYIECGHQRKLFKKGQDFIYGQENSGDLHPIGRHDTGS